MSATASARRLALLRNWLPNSVQPFFVPSSRLMMICATPIISRTGLVLPSEGRSRAFFTGCSKAQAAADFLRGLALSDQQGAAA
jgi:hypothetical protein